jgi:hypothetical protein
MAKLAALRRTQTLGLLGLLPFFALALLTWLPADVALGHAAVSTLARQSLVAYTAVILSFLGAVHWGIVLTSEVMPAAPARRLLDWGVMPSLLGWLALLMMFVSVAPWLVYSFLIADLLLARWMDGTLLHQHAVIPAGFLELRTRLTAGATIALAIALAASF